MITTSPLPNGDVLVTFMTDDPRPVSVVGTFNDWDPGEHPLVEEIDGRRYVTIALPSTGPVIFRYLAGDGEFYDDPMADRLEPNGFGQTHSVLDESLRQIGPDTAAEPIARSRPQPVAA
jgi:hypothetical protein